VGGDEFTLLLPEIARAEDAVTVARKVQRVLAAPFLVEGHEASVTASIGVSLFPDDATDADQLLKNADVAMYRAKDEGRDGYELFSRTLADADRT
jgi:diguanylate cyclase (GGDEF)-like protein